MNTNEITRDAIKRALLGYENPAPEEGLEIRIFTEESIADSAEEGTLAERLWVSEDELIDDFACGDLEDDERGRFREVFLCTEERRSKLAFATTLHDLLGSKAEPDAPLEIATAPDPTPRLSWFQKFNAGAVWRYAQAALVLFALAGSVLLFVEKLQLQGRIGAMMADRVVLEEQIASLREAGERGTASVSAIAVRLAPGLLRGPGEVERVIIPESSELIHVQLDLGIDDYASYRAALHDANGDELWTQSKLQAKEMGETVAVTVILPSELLPFGDYYFRLSGVTASGDLELVGRYHFRTLGE